MRLLSILLLLTILLAACGKESRQFASKAQQSTAISSDLCLLNYITPRLKKLRLSDTVISATRIVLVDSCSERLLSSYLDGWESQCGAMCVKWNYHQPVLLIGHLLESSHYYAVQVPVVLEDNEPEGMIYEIRFYRMDEQQRWHSIGRQQVGSQALVQVSFVDLDGDNWKEICLQSGLAMHGDISQRICTYLPSADSIHHAGDLFGAEYTLDKKKKIIQETAGSSQYSESRILYQWIGYDLVPIKKAYLSAEDHNAGKWRLDYFDRSKSPDSLSLIFSETHNINKPSSQEYNHYWGNFFKW